MAVVCLCIANWGSRELWMLLEACWFPEEVRLFSDFVVYLLPTLN